MFAWIERLKMQWQKNRLGVMLSWHQANMIRRHHARLTAIHERIQMRFVANEFLRMLRHAPPPSDAAIEVARLSLSRDESDALLAALLFAIVQNSSR